jgi:RNA-directed DNA polymerase
VQASILRGESHVVDADLSKYFDTIPHRELLRSLARRISDGKMLRLLRMWLKAPVEGSDAEGRVVRTGGEDSKVGTPQGGVISPLLANVYIHRLLQAWETFDLESKLQARIINYADDLVIVCRGTAEGALEWLRWITGKSGLCLNEAKTCIRDARRESFDFLGYTFGPQVYRKSGRTYLGIAPSKKRVEWFKQALRSVLHVGNHAPVGEVVAEVNRKLRGWAAYLSIGTVAPAYRAINHYTLRLPVPARALGARAVAGAWAGVALACVDVKPVREPDAGNPHVRFDERVGETGRLAATAPRLDSTPQHCRFSSVLLVAAPAAVSIRFVPASPVLP